MTYYLFNIDPIYKSICSEYDLYHILKGIYYHRDNSLAKEIEYHNLTKKINKKDVNMMINNTFIDNRFYHQNNMLHIYNNKYRKEYFYLNIGNSIMLLKTNYYNNMLFNLLEKYSLFVCDFYHQDYFWISESCC